MTADRVSIPARLSAILGLAAVAATLLGMVGAYFRLLSPYLGFRLFGAGLAIGGLLALVLGIVGLVQVRKGLAGRRQARLGTLLGAGLVATLAARLLTLGGSLPIHDLTTDPEDPPGFAELAKHPDNLGRDLTYPNGYAKTKELQLEHHADLRPIELPVAPEAALEAAQQVARDMGWTVVWTNGELGILEAYEESGIFRFVDDVVVRVRGAGASSVVDVRSTSRVGISDLGANAARIAAFRERLLAAAQG